MKKNTILLIVGILIAIVTIVALMNAKEKTTSTSSTTGETEHGGFFGFIEGLFSGVNVNVASSTGGE